MGPHLVPTCWTLHQHEWSVKAESNPWSLKIPLKCVLKSRRYTGLVL